MRREDVSDLAEGSPGLTLEPEREDGRARLPVIAPVCEEMVKNKGVKCRLQGEKYP